MDGENLVTWLSRSLQGNPPELVNCAPETFRELIRLADWHGITPLLYHQLQQAGQLDGIPALLRDALISSHYQAIAATLASAQELGRVIALLNTNGFDYILFKGTPLSWTLYPAAHLRARCDTDILFPDKNSALRAAGLIREIGYQTADAITGDFVMTQLCCYKTSKSGFLHNLDCHWKINNHPYFSDRISFDEIQLTAMTLSSPGQARYPSPVYSLLVACLHRVAHIPDGIADRLIWLYDIHLLINTFNEQQLNELVQRAIQKGLAAVCLDGMLKAQQFLGTRIEPVILERLQQHADDTFFKPHYQQSPWRYTLDQFRALPGWRARLKLLRENLFPPVAYIQKKYATSNPLLLPYYYLLRVIQGLPKLMGR